MPSLEMRNRLKQIINWKRVRGNIGEHVITIGYTTIFLSAVLAAYVTVRASNRFLLTADSLWIEDYLRDWLFHGVDMRTWQTPGAPNFFPEMFLYGFFRYITGSVYWSFIGFGFAKIAFYGVVFYKLLSLTRGISRIHKLWFSMLCISVLLLVAILLGSQFQYIRFLDFWQLFVPWGHGGAITNALLAILIMLEWLIDSPKKHLLLFPLLLISIVGSLSDRLYMVWFALPALGAVILLFILKRVSWKMAGLLVTILSISDFIGRKIFAWLVPLQQVPYDFSLQVGWRSTVSFYSVLFAEGWYHPFVLFSYVCLSIVTIIRIYKIWKSLKAPSVRYNPLENSQSFLLFFAFLGLPMSFLAIIAMNRPETQYFTGGDLMALSIWPFSLIMTSYGLRVWSKGWFHGLVILLLAGYIISMAISSPSMSFQNLLTPTDPYSEMVKCLDKNVDKLGNGSGIADYWQARKINLFSQKGIYVDQAMGGELMVFQWVSNRKMYEDKKHTFVITNTPTNLNPILEEDVINYFGKPDNRLICDGFPVLLYKDGLQVTVPLWIQLQNLLTGKSDRLILTRPTELLTSVGEWHGASLYSTGEAGWLITGPYITLPKGTYRVEWFGNLEHNELNEIGIVDVSSDQGSKVYKQDVVDRDTISSLSDDRLAVLQFTLKRERPLVEFRFRVNDGVLLSIDKVIISLVR
jgi:hypothetical protein